ncbi:hypothetical protein OV203_08425 [Nannocystis sp. ILAH1]|uniref:hypothetical protein n=1 Tax=unclassified Nannocystis TaxID=2627009 RepID=UPI00226EB6F2|nr:MULTISPECIES: hypothetical protein [unclassified Nannocystis]MCY0987146.1 hypothetical protein [Nannocystis sp. ILAH1]MCY1072029.1 hypothetical protein [Nannocystis sp. RBIL2]
MRRRLELVACACVVSLLATACGDDDKAAESCECDEGDPCSVELCPTVPMGEDETGGMPRP